MRPLAIILLAALAGCSGTNPVEMTCRATLLYNRQGANSAVLAFEKFDDKRNYVVANNLATYLMLRGFKTSNKADFDRAYSVLQSMDMSQKPHPLIRYVALLKFMASASGSYEKPYELSEHCAPATSSAACAAMIASDVINQKASVEGTKSKTYIDFLALYSRTHLGVFGSEFQLQEDDWAKQFSREYSSCGSTGKEAPGTEHVSVPSSGP